jgi:RNA polymerase sigma factor (sigma-70 family)
MPDLTRLHLIQSYLDARARRVEATIDESLAWHDFYATHDPMVRAIVLRSTGSREDLDDLDQDIWLSLVRRLPKLALDPGRGTLDTWIAAIARRQAARHMRGRYMRRNEVLTDEQADRLLDPALGPVTTIERRQRQEQVRAILVKLGANMCDLNRKIIEEYWIEDRSTSAIAAALAVSEERVWSIIRRARPKLLNLLSRAGLDVKSEKN